MFIRHIHTLGLYFAGQYKCVAAFNMLYPSDFSRLQVVALVAYVLAYFPGGIQTLRLGGSLALRGAGSLLPR